MSKLAEFITHFDYCLEDAQLDSEELSDLQTTFRDSADGLFILESAAYSQEDVTEFGREVVLNWIQEDHKRLHDFGDTWTMQRIKVSVTLEDSDQKFTRQISSVSVIFESDCLLSERQQLETETLEDLKQQLIAEDIAIELFDLYAAETLQAHMSLKTELSPMQTVTKRL
jgi:signal recognition particle GTPase